MSFVNVEVKKSRAWVSNGRGKDPEFRKMTSVQRGKMKTFVIQESLTELVDDSRTMEKIGRSLSYGDMKVCSFRDALHEFVQCVLREGDGNWLAHSIDNDLQFLQMTDSRYETGLFPKSLRAFPDYSTIAGWSNIAKVCTQHALTLRCPLFFKEYTAWMTMNGYTATPFSASLESFVRFLRDDREYKQQHIAPADVHDLCDVLALAKPPLDGKSFMISFPVASWNCTREKTSST